MSITVPLPIPTATLTPPVFSSVFQETEETVRARLLANLPDGLPTDEGSFPRDFLEICVQEGVRKWAMLDLQLAQQFVWWASGQQLDALGAEYGQERGIGTYATGNQRFIAPPGTQIGSGTIVELAQTDPDADRIQYKTVTPATVLVPAAGYVDIPAQALAVGMEYNAQQGAVTLLASQVNGVTALENSTAYTNGSDPDTDDTFRGKILAQAALPVGSGTQIDYLAWGLEISGVGDVAVYPLWDTTAATPFTGIPNGTVLLSLRDPSLMPVDYSTVQQVQEHIDPSRQMLATFEAGEGWTLFGGSGVTLGTDAVHRQIGSVATELSFTAAALAVIQLQRGMDLSRFSEIDDIYLWVYSSDWSKVVPGSSYLKLINDAGDYFKATWNLLSGESGVYPVATAAPSSGSGWWLWRVSPVQFVKTGAPVWSGITVEEVGVDTTAGVQVNLNYLTQRALTSGSTGKGRAPIGAAVSVITPSFFNVLITITGMVMAPGYALSDTPGTTNLKTQLIAALNLYFRQLQPGQPIRVVDLVALIDRTPGVIDFVLAAPSANITPPPTQYAQLDPAFSVVV